MLQKVLIRNNTQIEQVLKAARELFALQRATASAYRAHQDCCWLRLTRALQAEQAGNVRSQDTFLALQLEHETAPRPGFRVEEAGRFLALPAADPLNGLKSPSSDMPAGAGGCR